MNKIFLIIGNTGTGKTRLINDVILEMSDSYNIIIKKLPTYTTRLFRGKDEYEEIVSIPSNCMDFLIENDFFIEYDRWDDSCYASPYPENDGPYIKPVTLPGLQKFKKEYKERVVGIYIDVSYDIAIQRLIERGMKQIDADVRFKEYEELFKANYKEELIDYTIKNNSSYMNALNPLLQIFEKELKKGE